MQSIATESIRSSKFESGRSESIGIAARIAGRAAAAPDSVAITSGTAQLTFADLDRQSTSSPLTFAALAYSPALRRALARTLP